MKILTLSFAAGLLLCLHTPAAKADNLLIERVQSEKGVALPKRGTSMSQVEARFGAPNQKIPAVGGGSRSNPAITRWVYNGFSVYFENSHVVDAVLNKATPEEVGPAPARR
jgi:hypothetical protein